MPKKSPNQSNEVTCRQCKLTFVPSFEFDFYADESDPKVGLCERCFMLETFSENPKRDPVYIPNGHETTICLIGKKQETCKFLSIDGKGYQCLKNSSLEKIIIERASSMRAKGDNCSGPPDFKSLLK